MNELNFQTGRSKPFKVVSSFDMAGDQREAVESL